MKKLIRRLFGPKPDPNAIAPWMVWKDQPFLQAARAKYTMPGIQDIRCYFLQSCLRSIADVPGDVAECGVREGKSACYMFEACEQSRQYYLFDSFEGLSDPVPDKDKMTSAFRRNSKTRMFAVDAPAVMARLAAMPGFHVKQGWIPDRFAEVADRQFALVHIDVDLYEPTKASLEFFYPRMSPHGIIVCDDYGSGYYPGARQVFDEYFADRPEKPIELPQGQGFIVKR